MKSQELILRPEEKSAFLAENWTPTELERPEHECSHCGPVFKTLEFKAILEDEGFKAIRCPN